MTVCGPCARTCAEHIEPYYRVTFGTLLNEVLYPREQFDPFDPFGYQEVTLVLGISGGWWGRGGGQKSPESLLAIGPGRCKVGRMHRTQFNLPVKTHSMLKARADADGISMAEIVRRALGDWLALSAPAPAQAPTPSPAPPTPPQAPQAPAPAAVGAPARQTPADGVVGEIWVCAGCRLIAEWHAPEEGGYYSHCTCHQRGAHLEFVGTSDQEWIRARGEANARRANPDAPGRFA